MSLAEYFCRPSLIWSFRIWPYPTHNPMVAALGVGLAGMPMGTQTQLLGNMCGANGAFQDWSTHQGRALGDFTVLGEVSPKSVQY